MAWGTGADGALPVGSLVQFNTALGGTVTGHVVCFDANLKVLAIKEQCGSKAVLRIFNLNMLSDIKELSPATAESAAECSGVSHTTTGQAAERRKATLERRRIEAMSEDVPLTGQRAFIHLRRTLDDVSWRGVDISVLNRVLVKAPYTPASAEAVHDNDQCRQALEHVRKLLAKPFVADARLLPCCRPAAGAAPAVSTSVPPTPNSGTPPVPSESK